MTRILDSLQNSRFGDFVEYDTVGFLLVQSQHLTQVPRDGFSLAVFIGCEPDLLCLLCVVLQFLDEFLFLLRYLVFRFERTGVDTHLLLFQVADVTVARHDLIVTAQEFLNGFRLGRRLYYHQILLHIIFYFFTFLLFYTLLWGGKSKQKFWLHLIYICNFLFS